MSVLLIATLDTKGPEAAFVRERLLEAGVKVTVLDAGVLNSPSFTPDINRERVFDAAGAKYEAVRSAGDRGRAVALAAEGAAKIAADLHRHGQLTGVLGLGGSAGTTIAAAAMRALPVGLPKLIVSTLASGQVRPYVGTRDILMMPSVVDIAGLNRISRLVLANAAGAMAGMVRVRQSEYRSQESGVRSQESGNRNQETGIRKQESEISNQESAISNQESGIRSQESAIRKQESGVRKQESGIRKQESGTGSRPVIAATMFGVTTPCVEAARAVLEQAGCEVLVFHATGIGGQTMEDLIRDGLVAGVLDITTTELADELIGGILSAGPERLTAAALAGVPQVVSVGALDMVNFGPPNTVPEKYRGRRFYQHNPNVTLMRTTPEEMDRLGLEVAQKVCAARGPTALLLPLRGVSAIDIEGGPFWWPEADAALFQSIRNWVHPGVEVVELDRHVNDREFAEAAARKLLKLLGNKKVSGSF